MKFGEKSAGRFEHACCFCLYFLAMPFCAALFCSNRTPRDSKRGISFHRLPNCPDMVGKEKFLPKRAQIFVFGTLHGRLLGSCTPPQSLGWSNTEKKKKPDAVPTIFKKPRSVPQEKRNGSERKIKKEERLVLWST